MTERGEATICEAVGEDFAGPGAPPPRRTVEVRVPASTSNLGAGFDCFGLALQLYLTVRATIVSDAGPACRIRSLGTGASAPPRHQLASDNLIFRAMRFAADKEKIRLPHVRLAVHNEIPMGGGLGSSAAAIVAGLALAGAVSGRSLSSAKLLDYAAEFEGHADNAAASILGGWVVTCMCEDGRVLAVKRAWPALIKVVVVTPHTTLETARARAVLPPNVSHKTAVFNLQRAALFGAALEEHSFDLLWEAMRDCLHQPYRQELLPGLAEALATPRIPGLLGIAMSGAGPSVLALASGNFGEIGDLIARKFNERGHRTTVRLLEIDNHGQQTKTVRG